MENNMEVPQNIKIVLPKDICTLMFIKTLFTIARRWRIRGEVDKRVLTFSYKMNKVWTSLVVQWIGIHLPVLETVRSLVWEESICQGAPEFMHHDN